LCSGYGEAKRKKPVPLCVTRTSSMDKELKKGVSLFVEGAPPKVRIVNGTNAAPGQFPFQVRLNVPTVGEYCCQAQCTDCW